MLSKNYREERRYLDAFLIGDLPFDLPIADRCLAGVDSHLNR